MRIAPLTLLALFLAVVSVADLSDQELALLHLSTAWASEVEVQSDSQDVQRWAGEKPRTLGLRFGLYTPGSDFNFQPDRGPGVTFVPGNSPRVYTELSYERIAVGIQIPSSIQQSESSDNSSAVTSSPKGQSNFRDFQFRSFGHRNNFEFLHQRVDGFALQDWPDANRPGFWRRRGDVRIEINQFNWLQSLSPAHYSKAIAMDLKGKQIKSGGALLAFLSVGEFRLSADQALLPAELAPTSGEIGQLRGLVSQFVLIGSGYGHVLPITDSLFAGFNVLGGLGLRRQKYEASEVQDWHWGPAHRVGVRPIIGFNGKKWLGSFSLLVDSTAWRVGDAQFSQATFALKGSIGYRFEDVEIPSYDLIENGLRRLIQ